MRTIKLLMATSGAALLLWGCDVKDPIYHTLHPDHGMITLTTDWSEIGNGITKPSAWTAAYGGVTVPVDADTYTIPNLIDPGSYTLYAYNTAANVAVSGTTATASYVAGTLGWLFTGKLTAEVEKDTDYEFTMIMAQQVCQLTLVLTPEGDAVDEVAGVTGTLLGAAGTLDLDSGTHGTPSSVALTFTKVASGADAGKWTATVYLMGVAGTSQMLNLTITYSDTSIGDQQLDPADLTAQLAAFNGDKRTPFALDGTMKTLDAISGINTTVEDWESGTIKGDAEME